MGRKAVAGVATPAVLAVLALLAMLAGFAAPEVVGGLGGAACTLDDDAATCYNDGIDGVRILPVGPLHTTTQGECASLCATLGWAMSGLEDGDQCFCGNAWDPRAILQQVPLDRCNTPCPGNASQNCGGQQRLLQLQANCTALPPRFQACLTANSSSFPFCNVSLTAEERMADLLGRLSLPEKIAMISPQPKLGSTCATHTAGKASIGLGSYSWLIETNTGVAAACMAPGICATTFNGPMGIAASFNRTMWQLKGQVLGRELRAFNNAGWHRGTAGFGAGSISEHVPLEGYGPNINIARDPRYGRNSELPGEDPFLSGSYAVSMLQGMQMKDAQGYPLMLAYLKHFTAYSTEANRGHDTHTISQHDFFETYLPQFEMGMRQGEATGVMCSYAAENGAPSCANGWLLNDVLRKQWNRSDAHVTTDCGAVEDLLGAPVNAADNKYAAAITINNGTDLEMGGTAWTTDMINAVSAGLTSEDAVNTAVTRSYTPQFRAGRFDPPASVSWTKLKPDVINSTAHRRVQMEAALQAIVLLKNDGPMLPLKKGTKVAVLGPMGTTRQGLLSDYAGDQQCYSGYDCIATIAEAIAAVNGDARTTAAAGVDVDSTNTSGIAAALALGNAADVIILVMGIDHSIEHEGIDRTDTALPGQQEAFADAVIAIGKPVVLILSNGGAVAIDNIIAGSMAIVEAFNPGVVGSHALATTLFGDANRWGKLPITLYPHEYIHQQPMTNYNMAKAPGRTYKYYTGTALFPFGYGLSYTSFDLACKATTPGPYSYTCMLTNTGKMGGDEVIMVYHSAGDDVRSRARHPVPMKALVGFDRVSLAPSASGSVTFHLPPDVLSLVDENGEKRLYNGTHLLVFSRGVGLESTFTIIV